MAVDTLAGTPTKLQLLIGVWIVLILGLILAVGYWVYRDAALRGSTYPFGWAIASVVGFQIIPVIYLLLRERIGPRSEPPSRFDRTLNATVVGIVVVFIIGALVTPPDPFAQVAFATPAVLVVIPAAYAYASYREQRTVPG
ncbi:hypothetical protein SAMN06269185_2933 [Natronoarchaeum philippinense]|uniref:Sec-independent protein translocase protein TatC n=1 Tax=Natronoarchaeum philippinense TaxID=558529 RepID=A0A285PBI8_NATPI|nr:hypothetical protein [Natronoarchaeum philippinense]SNZ17221.1 hypothetical protein SAMN06269185_2933 [Natronoarchaeum philippinense]